METPAIALAAGQGLSVRAALASALLLLVVGCARADPAADLDAQWAVCAGDPDWTPRIEGCTAVIRHADATLEQRAEAYLNRGAARGELGQAARAAADFGRSLRLRPNLAHAYFERGNVHQVRGAFEAAIADYDRALRLDPRFALAARRRELALAGRVQTIDDTLAAVSALIAREPGNAAAFNNRCWVRATSGVDLDLALVDCNESLRLRPADAATLDSRGLVHLKRGDAASALADYEAATALDPTHAHYLYGRGVARHRLGDTPGGEADIRAALALDAGIAETYRRFGVTPDPAAAPAQP